MKRGEVYCVNFGPAQGGEIRKTRPAIIVGNNVANRVLNRVQVVPLTSSSGRLYPSEAVVLVNGDIVRTDELARINARATPGKFVLARPRIHVDARVAIAVGHVHIASAWPDRRRRGPVERVATPFFRGRVAGADF